MIDMALDPPASMQAKLLEKLARRSPTLQARAAALDAAAQFPAACVAELREDGLFTATLPTNLGGAGFGVGAGGAATLARLLYALGAANLSLARIFEAHINALQLILRYGTARQMAVAADDAHAGHLFALWVTDPNNAAGNAAGADAARLDAAMVLRGGKAFCSAAGVASRALITAAGPNGAQMLIVRLESDARVLPSRIRLAGMRAAVTGAVDFTGMRLNDDAVLGTPGDYLAEPVFSAGAWRGSAAALGGLGALLRLHQAEILRRRRDGDPHQRARFGQVMIAHETARLWVDQAALRACLEDDTPAAVVAYVNLARIAVEDACLAGIRHSQRSLGLQAFMAGHPMERVARDLATYLRQPAPDETLDVAAGHYLHAAWPGR